MKQLILIVCVPFVIQFIIPMKLEPAVICMNILDKHTHLLVIYHLQIPFEYVTDLISHMPIATCRLYLFLYSLGSDILLPMTYLQGNR